MDELLADAHSICFEPYCAVRWLKDHQITIVEENFVISIDKVDVKTAVPVKE